MADIQTAKWDPRKLLQSNSIVDRYVAVKALGYIGNESDVSSLSALLQTESDGRVGLEIASSLCRLVDQDGYETLKNSILSPSVNYLPIEAVFILTELARDVQVDSTAVKLLKWCAQNSDFEGNEIRQAAIWGLGKSGARDYVSLMDFFEGFSDEETIHAIEAFSNDIDATIASELFNILVSHHTTEKRKSIALYLLSKKCSTEIAAPKVLQLLNDSSLSKETRGSLLAILGSFSKTEIEHLSIDDSLQAQLCAVQWLQPERNWLMGADKATALSFVAAQNLS